jgi:hypothetical protein
MDVAERRAFESGLHHRQVPRRQPADESIRVLSPLFVGAPSSTVGKNYELLCVETFQSPLRRGSFVDSWPTASRRGSCEVSVPSWSGLLRRLARLVREERKRWSFSPLFVGAPSSTVCVDLEDSTCGCVSVPSSSGLLRRHATFPLQEGDFGCFSPLFVGAASSTTRRRLGSRPGSDVSVPSSSGLLRRPNGGLRASDRDLGVSVPSSSGLLRRLLTTSSRRTLGSTFQPPLRRGSFVDIGPPTRSSSSLGRFSPLFVGAPSSTTRLSPTPLRSTWGFSPLFVGAPSSTTPKTTPEERATLVSVPSSSGRLRRHLARLRAAAEELRFSPLFVGAPSSTARRSCDPAVAYPFLARLGASQHRSSPRAAAFLQVSDAPSSRRKPEPHQTSPQ